MTDHDLTDDEWERVRDLLPGQHGRGRPWRQHRQVLNGILWVLGNRSSWRAMPDRYGPWETAYSRWRRWYRTGHWSHICARLGRADIDTA